MGVFQESCATPTPSRSASCSGRLPGPQLLTLITCCAGYLFLKAMDSRATEILRDFAPQHISVLLWATAKLGHNPGPQLLTAAIAAASAEMSNFNPQNVANSLWAYATLGFYPGHAFMATAAQRQVDDMAVRPRGVLA